MEDVNFERTSGPVSEGVHLFEIVKGEQKTAQSGNDYIAWSLMVKEGSADDGKMVWHNTSLTPQSRWVLEQFLDAVEAPSTGRGNPEAFIGKFVGASIYHEDYQGVPKARVERVFLAKDIPGMSQEAIASATSTKKRTKTGPEVKDTSQMDLPF